MIVCQLIHKTRSLVPILRAMSSQSPLVDLSIDNDGVSILTLQKPPVNSFNLELVREMGVKLDEVAKNKSKGLVITSSSPTVFSSGGDIMEFYKTDIKRTEELLRTFDNVCFKLFESSFITAAAINGHALGSGCVLSLSTEYKVMVGGKFSIGLNETALGIVAPGWFMDIYSHHISERQAELALTSGRMFSVDEALKVGFIDEVAFDKADAIAKCKDFIKRINKISPVARAITKQKMREGILKKFYDRREKDLQELLVLFQTPQVQKNLEMYIQSLKKKAALQ